MVATAKTFKDVSPHEFVKSYAALLKRSGKMELPQWTDIVKTGVLKELAPYDPDWYYIRVASMAKKVYLRGGLGVGAFRKSMEGARGTVVVLILAKAAALLLVTFFNSCRQ